MKKILLLAALLFSMAATAQTQYLTLKVSIAFKNKSILHRMVIDTGTDKKHPLNGKVVNIDNGGIKITKAENDFIVFNNEVDLLTYLENNGWDLVSVNEVMIIQDKYLQYLFKSE